MTTCLWKSPTGQITNRTHLYLSLHVHEKRVDFLCSTFFQRFSMFFCSIHCNLCHYFDDFPTFFFFATHFSETFYDFPSWSNIYLFCRSFFFKSYIFLLPFAKNSSPLFHYLSYRFLFAGVKARIFFLIVKKPLKVK